MPSSLSHKTGSQAQKRGAQGGAGDGSGGGEGSGGGGGGGGGKPVKVAFARNQAEAEMIQGLLSGVGIPSILKRSRGFDAPEFLAAGPHDIFVSAHVAPRATEVLADTLIESEDEERLEPSGAPRRGRGEISPARLALWIVASTLAAVVLIWVLYQLS
jgi:hypothetical protein